MSSFNPFDAWPPPPDEQVGPRKGVMHDYGELLRRVSMRPARECLAEVAYLCLTRQAMLMDLSVLAARSAAQVVVTVIGTEAVNWYRGLPVPISYEGNEEEWLGYVVAEALDDLIIEDAQAVDQGRVQPEQSEPRHTYLQPWMKIPLNEVLRSALRFNQLPHNVRRCFFEVFIEQSELRVNSHPDLGTPDRIRAYAERGLRALVNPPPQKILDLLDPDTGPQHE